MKRTPILKRDTIIEVNYDNYVEHITVTPNNLTQIQSHLKEGYKWKIFLRGIISKTSILKGI